MKLLKVQRVRQYELTYLLPGSFASTDVETAKAIIEKLLKKHKIKVLNQEDWGKRQLAYPIKYAGKRQDEAFYTHLVLEAEASATTAFEKDLYLIQEVIRHLLVLARQDKKKKAGAESKTEVDDKKPAKK